MSENRSEDRLYRLGGHGNGKRKVCCLRRHYTHGSSVGIHVYDLDVEAGYMTEREVVPVNNASHVAKSNNGKVFVFDRR